MAQFIRRTKDAIWADCLEAIIQVLRTYNVLYSFLALFVSFLPAQEELYVNYLWRLREAYY